MFDRTRLVAISFAVGLVVPVFGSTIYVEQKLVSDLPGVAPVTDGSLVNPWGLAATATSPWWISDNGTGLSTVYNASGVKALTVTIPPPAGGTSAAPTGIVANLTTSDFQVTGAKSSFIFDTEDGTISAWRTGTSAVLEVDNSASGAVYKGLAEGNNGSGNFLYAANFNSGHIDVFNGSWAPATLSGGFVDPSLPTGYAPFDIQNINGQLYVTYALQNAAKHDDVAGAGHGYIDVFDLNGNFVKRLVSQGALDSPWGLAVAPPTFGTFSGDLVVGNFGDGTINAFNANTGTFLGTLTDSSNNPIVIQGLWGLAFGNGASAGPANSLYFTAGIPGSGAVEDHGLFGDLVATPEPSVFWTLAGGLGLLASFRRRRRS